MLAKNVNDNACFLDKRGACEFFASKLAPTKSFSSKPPPTFDLLQPEGPVYAPTACNRLDRKSLGDTSNCFLNERLKCAESVKPHL